METQNVTVSLSKDLLRRVKVLAAERQTSISSLLTRSLEDLVAKESRFARARRHHLAWLGNPADLGTDGHARVSREELHERQ